MKILHLSNVAGKLGGGVSAVVNALFYHQANKGLKTKLWFLGRPKDEKELSEEQNFDIDDLYSIQKKSFLSPRIFLKFKNLLREIDLIHQHGVFLPTSILSILANNQVKVVISPHGYLEPEKMKVSPLKKKLILFLYEYFNLRKSHCLVACSKQEAAYLRDFGFNQPIAILPNGVDDSFLKINLNAKGDLDFKRKYQINADKRILLYLSRIHPFKGLELFLKSLDKVKDEFRKKNWIFVIAGPSELGHEEHLKRIVKEKRIEDIVKFIGPQYGQNKIQTLDSAECFVLPSKGENFGISVIESLARGVPVITTKDTPWERLNETECGWCIDRTITEFSKTLSEVISLDKSKLTQMGKAGHKLIEREFSWSNITNQSNNLYKWVLNEYREEYNKGFDLYNR